MIGAGAGIPGGPKAVENDHSVLSGKAAVTGEAIHEVFPGCCKAVPSQITKLRFGKNKVVSVDDNGADGICRIFCYSRCISCRGSIDPRAVGPASDRTEFPEHDLFQFTVVDTLHAVDRYRGPGPPILLFQCGRKMHVVPHLLPCDIESGAVCAENGPCWPVRISLRLV